MLVYRALTSLAAADMHFLPRWQPLLTWVKDPDRGAGILVSSDDLAHFLRDQA
jgi:hypothetical protein